MRLNEDYFNNIKVEQENPITEETGFTLEFLFSEPLYEYKITEVKKFKEAINNIPWIISVEISVSDTDTENIFKVNSVFYVDSSHIFSMKDTEYLAMAFGYAFPNFNFLKADPERNIKLCGLDVSTDDLVSFLLFKSKFKNKEHIRDVVTMYAKNYVSNAYKILSGYNNIDKGELYKIIPQIEEKTVSELCDAAITSATEFTETPSEKKYTDSIMAFSANAYYGAAAINLNVFRELVSGEIQNVECIVVKVDGVTKKCIMLSEQDIVLRKPKKIYFNEEIRIGRSYSGLKLTGAAGVFPFKYVFNDDNICAYCIVIFGTTKSVYDVLFNLFGERK